MNRRSFFKRIAVAAVAAPALTDVMLCTEPAYKIEDMTGCPPNPAWPAQKEMSVLHRKILEYVWNTNPYADLFKKESFGA